VDPLRLITGGTRRSVRPILDEIRQLGVRRRSPDVFEQELVGAFDGARRSDGSIDAP
jgi:hypothetical protein